MKKILLLALLTISTIINAQILLPTQFDEASVSLHFYADENDENDERDIDRLSGLFASAEACYNTYEQSEPGYDERLDLCNEYYLDKLEEVVLPYKVDLTHHQVAMSHIYEIASFDSSEQIEEDYLLTGPNNFPTKEEVNKKLGRNN